MQLKNKEELKVENYHNKTPQWDSLILFGIPLALIAVSAVLLTLVL